MFLDELPPDTSIYAVAGYVIFFVIAAVYLVSLFLRARNLNQDLLTLNNLREEQQARVAAPAPVRSKAKAGKAKPGKAKPTHKKASRKK